MQHYNSKWGWGMPGGYSGVTSRAVGWSLSAHIPFVHFTSFVSFPSHLYDSCNPSRLFSLLLPLFVFFYISILHHFISLRLRSYLLWYFSSSRPSSVFAFPFQASSDVTRAAELYPFIYLFHRFLSVLIHKFIASFRAFTFFCPLFTFPFAFLPC